MNGRGEGILKVKGEEDLISKAKLNCLTARLEVLTNNLNNI